MLSLFDSSIANRFVFDVWRIISRNATSTEKLDAYCYKIGMLFATVVGILTVTTPSTYAAAPATFLPSWTEIGSMILLSI